MESPAMSSTSPDFARALDLARTASARPWTEEEWLPVARALLSTRTDTLEEAAQLLEGLADKEVMRPAMVGVYVRIAADIRALATRPIP
jgi:hypothetical protein